MKKLDKILDNVMRFLMAVAMFALLAGGTWQIFTRWILHNPSTVTDEFLRYVLIWASMIGSAYCFYSIWHWIWSRGAQRVRSTLCSACSSRPPSCSLWATSLFTAAGS